MLTIKHYCMNCFATSIFYRITPVLVMYFLTSCNVVKVKGDSYWESQRDNFKYSNLKNFISDSILKEKVKSCYKVRHKSLQGVFSPGKVYLYSWQSSDSTKNEFTVVKDRGELGLDIFYMIMDKNDNLITKTKLAGRGMEAEYIFEIRSEFIAKDSILQIRSITQDLDLEKRKKMDKFIGDSTFLYLTIDKNGKIEESIFKEVKDLNYSNK